MEDAHFEQKGFAIKRTSEDKLTYKNIIADAINWCRRSRGKLYFKNSVKGLEDIITFDIPGYTLESDMEKIRDKLNIEKKERRVKREKELGSDFYGNAEQALFKIEQSEWYWNAYFKKIIQLLASHNLLMETEKYIPIREKKQIEEGYEENEMEE